MWYKTETSTRPHMRRDRVVGQVAQTTRYLYNIYLVLDFDSLKPFEGNKEFRIVKDWYLPAATAEPEPLELPPV